MTDDRPPDDPADEPRRNRSDGEGDGQGDAGTDRNAARSDPDDAGSEPDDAGFDPDDAGSDPDDAGTGPDDAEGGPDDVDDGNDSNHPENGRDHAREGPGAGEWLTTLLQSLERFDRLSGRGRRRGRTALDFDVSIGSGLDSLEDSLSGDRRSGRSGSDSRADRESLGRRPGGRRGSSRSRRRPEPSGDHHLTTRTYENELLVTADVAGADREDVTVGFDDGALVVGVHGRELERVPVPWEDRTAEATVRNGVLTVRVEQDARE